MNKLWKKHKLLVIGIPCVLVLALALFIGYVHLHRAAEVRECIESGNQYLSELDYEQAIASYRQALDIDEKNREANLGLAEAYDGNNMPLYAEAVYSNMLEDDDTQADIYEKLSDLYIRQDKLDEARELIDTAVEKVEDEAITELRYITRPEPPAVNVEGGKYSERFRLELYPSGEHQTIYYTLDGTVPTAESAVYSSPLILPNGVTSLKAMVMNATGYQSDIGSWEYDLQIQDVLVELEEPLIEKIIREKLGLSYDQPIYNDDIEQITELYIVGTSVGSGEDRFSVYLEENGYTVDGNEYDFYEEGQIHTLSDLQYMPFLERAAVIYQPDLDISALSSCKGLKELCLAGDTLESGDIRVLSGLSSLERLNLGWNQIQSIDALSGLTSLKSLGVWGNRISDIQAVSGLTNLEYLDFSDNMVEDITAVAGLDKLQQLWMYYNKVRDISCLSGLPNLTVLMLRDNPIADPEEIRSIYPHLTRIDVDLLGLGGTEE